MPPRPEKIQSFKAAVELGWNLMKLMRLEDDDAGQLLVPPIASAASEYTSVNSLKDWGYTRTKFHPEYFASDSLKARCLQDIGLPFAVPPLDPKEEEVAIADKIYDTKGLKSVPRFTHVHDKPTTHGGQVYKPTRALFQTIIDRENGVLIVQQAFGPAYKVKQRRKGPQILPELKNWSDIAFLQWMDPQFEGQPNNLQAVVHIIIENPSTTAIINHVLKIHREQTDKHDEWIPAPDGLTWSIDSEEGKAFLGSPNGRGTGWLLGQHKEQLGWKAVDSVTLFEFRSRQDWSAEKHIWCLCFHIVEVTPQRTRLWDRISDVENVAHVRMVAVKMAVYQDDSELSVESEDEDDDKNQDADLMQEN
ncbi:hypothetical protein GQ44DRAFT_603811 [Phaeosphaeriaceae sp. PMI808]|nr:hypothetical protein GQ44DRAFT_603811 [Phaeosphaeriaceae sp. PMI808]